MFCSQCGIANTDDAKFCVSCGSAIGVVAPFHENPEPFYKAIIGTNNQEYYMNRFKEFDEKGKSGVTWHWPAFFVTLYWLLYRKMWGRSALYFFLPYFIVILLTIFGSAFIGIGFGIFFLLMWIVPPLFADAWYYKHCKKKIAECIASANDFNQQIKLLHPKGGTSSILVIILPFVVIAIIGILAAIALPAYQDYTTRAQISNTLVFSRQATAAVGEYITKNKAVPSNLAQAGFTESWPKTIRDLSINDKSGVMSITFAEPVAIAGKKLLMVPSLDGQNGITWKCASEEIRKSFLPNACH
jgi:Tfp pilus assembly major pilin PilA